MNYTGLTEFFDRLIFQTGGNDRDENKKAIQNCQMEHVRFFNDRTYVHRFVVLFERCTTVQKGFLSFLYMRVFVQPRISSGRPVSIMWKKIDRDIMDILKKCIDSDSDDEKDNGKLANDIKNKVLQELEKKQQQEEAKKKAENDKAEYEKKERKRLKKINKRKRLLERRALEHKKETSTEEDTDSEEFNEVKQLQNLQESIDEEDEETPEIIEHKQDTPEIIEHKQDTPEINEQDTPEIIEHKQDTPAIIEQDTPEDLNEKNDLSKCPCGSKTLRPDLHKKTLRHRNFIDMGIIHKKKSQRDRNVKRYVKNSRIITRCICGEDVKKSSKQLHEQSVKHKYFVQHGEKMPGGNYMVRCDCGTYFLKYNMARHKNTIGHLNYLATL
jgi:hypothetical protein